MSSSFRIGSPSSNGNVQYLPSTCTVFVGDTMELTLDSAPQDVALTRLAGPQECAELTWQQAHGTLTARKPGVVWFELSWTTASGARSNSLRLVVLPKASKALAGGNAVRHLLVQGPDMNFYLFSPNQAEWPTLPFLARDDKAFLASFPGGKEILDCTNGIIGTLLPTAFTTVEARSHTFYIINLPSLLHALDQAHRGYEYRSLLLGGPEQRGYLIPWTEGKGHAKEWPTSPAKVTRDDAFNATPQNFEKCPGALVQSTETFVQAKLHDDSLGKVLLYNLMEVLHFFNRQDAFRVVSSLYSRSWNGAYTYQFFRIDDSGVHPMGDITQEEMYCYQGGALRGAVLLSRVSSGSRDTYLYNINAYADSAEGWAPSHNKQNELLILTPGEKANDYYFFVQEGADNLQGDFTTDGNMLKHKLPDTANIAPSVEDAVTFGVATGIILDNELRKSAQEVDPTSSFISCYLLNLASLLSRPK